MWKARFSNENRQESGVMIPKHQIIYLLLVVIIISSVFFTVSIFFRSSQKFENRNEYLIFIEKSDLSSICFVLYVDRCVYRLGVRLPILINTLLEMFTILVYRGILNFLYGY